MLALLIFFATKDQDAETEPLTIKIIPAYSTVLLSNEILSFKSTENITVLANSSTEFYRGIMKNKELTKEKDFTIKEFYDLLKNWEGPAWPIYVIGKKDNNVISAETIYYILQ